VRGSITWLQRTAVESSQKFDCNNNGRLSVIQFE
jgi:hypothetical protein